MKEINFNKILNEYTLKVGNNLYSPAFIDNKNKNIYLSRSNFITYKNSKQYNNDLYAKMTPALVESLYRINFNVKYDNMEINELTKLFCEETKQFNIIRNEIKKRLEDYVN